MEFQTLVNKVPPSEAIKAMLKEKGVIDSALTTATQELAKTNSELEARKKELDAHVQTINKLVPEIAKHEHDLSTKSILQNELKELDDNVKSQQSNLDKLTGLLYSTENRIKELNKEIVILQDSVSQKRNDELEWSEKVAKSQQEVVNNQYRVRVLEDKAKGLEELASKVEKLMENELQLNQRVAELKGLISDLEKVKVERDTALSQLETAREWLVEMGNHQHVESDKLKRLQTVISNKEELLVEMVKSLENRTVEFNKLGKAIEENNRLLEDRQAVRQDIEERLLNITLQIQNKQKILQSHEDTINAQREKINSQNDLLFINENSLTNQKNELVTLKNELLTLIANNKQVQLTDRLKRLVKDEVSGD